MKIKKSLYNLKWDHSSDGDYASGKSLGRKIFCRFLAFMGSGEVGVYNLILPALLASWHDVYQKTNEADGQCYLNGQRDGFLEKLSEFLVVAAYMNNCALSEDNNFNPALIKTPNGMENIQP